MEKHDLLQEIYKAYNRARLSDERLIRLERLVEKGAATYEEAYELSSRAGGIIGDVVYRNLEEVWGTMAFEDASELIPRSLRYNHDFVADISTQIDETINKNAEIALKSLKPEFNQQEARNIAGDAVNGVSKNEFIKNCRTFSRKTVDDTIRINTQAKERAGLEVKVTRRYDGIGVHNRKDECKWCKERCGENMPYEEAYAKGAFERHPGCGCEILYTVGRRTQRQTDWTHNQWEEIQDPEDLKERREHGRYPGDPAFEEIKSRIRKERLPNVDINIYGLEFVKDKRPYFPPDHIMAGKGCKTGRQIDDIDRLVREYRFFTTDASKWQKQKARYQVFDEYGQIREIEIHWYQHPEVGKVEDKIKFDEHDRMFVDEWER